MKNHSGNLGNDTADTLVKEATQTADIIIWTNDDASNTAYDIK